MRIVFFHTVTIKNISYIINYGYSYGIRSFDTSAYYGPSEIILGTALKAIEKEFPRSSYKLACFNLHRLTDAKLTLRSRGQTTKCGRYGYDRANFDYSPVTIRASVTRSLERLHTDYLDAVYLHDVEYVSTPVGPAAPGGNAAALEDVNGVYGLARGDEGKVRGEGDRIILAAVAELWKMKEEGLIRAVGITGQRHDHHLFYYNRLKHIICTRLPLANPVASRPPGITQPSFQGT